jgi:hypothetical protein
VVSEPRVVTIRIDALVDTGQIHIEVDVRGVLSSLEGAGLFDIARQQYISSVHLNDHGADS